MNVSLEGKVAIVTGAFSGIGLAVTRAYLDSGARGVIAVDSRDDIPEQMAQARCIYGDRLVIVRGDVAKEETAVSFTKTAMDHLGKIDIFMNNAAISIVKPVHLHTEEEWDTVLGANVKSLYWAARYVVSVMMKQHSGLILVTGSISGEAGIPSQGAYAPSKGALHQMTRQMAIEYAKHGIRVNTIACGTVDTPIVHASAKSSGDPEGYWKMLRDAHPIGRIASAEEVASFFTYMATDLASFFTGSIIMMDGGYTAQ